MKPESEKRAAQVRERVSAEPEAWKQTKHNLLDFHFVITFSTNLKISAFFSFPNKSLILLQ